RGVEPVRSQGHRAALGGDARSGAPVVEGGPRVVRAAGDERRLYDGVHARRALADRLARRNGARGVQALEGPQAMKRSLAAVLVLTCACRLSHAAEPLRSTPAPAPNELAYEHGLKKGWMDFGWSPRKENPNGPVLHDVHGFGGWILAREQPMAAAAAGGLSFTFKAP